MLEIMYFFNSHNCCLILWIKWFSS